MEVIYGCGVVKTLLKGTSAVVSGVVTHTRPPDLKKIEKAWKIIKVAPIPPEWCIVVPRGRLDVPKGARGRYPPITVGFCIFCYVTTI